jgi:hypothetical protein
VTLERKLQQVLGADVARLGERLQLLWGGYGELRRAERSPGNPIIVKHVQPPREDRSVGHRRKLRSYDVEHAFYRQYAESCAAAPRCRVPQLVAAQVENDSWLFVLEDLDAVGFAGRRAYASGQDVTKVLTWLARFHARFLGQAPDQLWQVGTYWHLATRPDELRSMRHPALRRAAPRIDGVLSRARFRTLVHGDAKLENACFTRTGDGPGEVAFVDFQYVGGGVGVKDVAYFLNGCLSPTECVALVPSYLDEYFGALRAALDAFGHGSVADELEQEWRQLFPLAWVDFYRFVLGWAPGQFDGDPYSEQLTRDVLRRLMNA